VVSPGFTSNSGHSKFTFSYSNKTEEDSVLVIGTLYSGEFSADDVEIEFTLSPHTMKVSTG
jgi:hypothetical protein